MTTATNDVLATSIDSSTTLSLGTNSTSTTLGSQTQPTTINANNLTLYASGSGTNGQVLTQGNTYATWQAPSFVGTADKDLDMNGNVINNITSLIAITTMNINGQTQFDTSPRMPDPIVGNDGATKGYVDTLIGNYSGNGLSLYFNYEVAQTNPIIAPSVGVLHQTLAPINSHTTGNFYIMSSVALGENTLISTFTTDVGYPNTLTIPAGLWSMMIWGYTTNQNGQLYYYFLLNEVNSNGDFVAQIGTSGISSDVNAVSSTDPDVYHCSLAIVNGHTMASLTNRLQIEIYTNGTSPNSTILYTLFGGKYYSNVTTTLNGATSLLTQNNSWKGVNDFTAGFNTTAVDSTTTLALGTGTATTTTLGRSGGTTVINGATIGLTAPTINLTGAVKSNNIDTATAETLNIGNATTNSLALGRSGLAIANLNATSLAIGNNATTLAIGNNTGYSCAITIGQNSIPLSTTSLRGNVTVGGTFRSDTISTLNLETSSYTSAVKIYPGTTNAQANILTSTTRQGTTHFQNNSTLANIINIGNANTTTNFGGVVNATKIDAVGALSIGSGASTTSISLNNKLLSGVTLGVNQFINLSANTYSATTGTTVGSIGYMYLITTPNGGGFVNGANLTTSESQVYGTIASIPAGVYMVSCTIGLTTVAGNTFQNFWASISSLAYNNRSTPPSGVSSDCYYNISGVVAYTTASTLDANLYSIFSGTAPKMLSTNFRLSAVRIA